MVEYLTCNQQVTGSIPVAGSRCKLLCPGELHNSGAAKVFWRIDLLCLYFASNRIPTDSILPGARW
jgi:hypothetical protein